MSRRTKRRRHNHPSTYGYYSSSSSTTLSNEERLLHQTIQNAKLGDSRRNRGAMDIPPAPVFFPSVDDMEGSPLDYIEKIRPVAQRYGICKIIPPEGWKHTDFFAAEMEVPRKFSTKLQQLHRIQEGISFGDGDEYNPGSYLRYASNFTKEYKRREYPEHDLVTADHPTLSTSSEEERKDQEPSNEEDRKEVEPKEVEPKEVEPKEVEPKEVQLKDSTSPVEENRRRFTPSNLEQDYWELVENRHREVSVEYGNDVDTLEFGSGFPLSERERSIHGKVDPKKKSLPDPKFGTDDYYKETWWNLNNIPNAPDSVLRHVKVGINGINVPWMYYGSLFTTFCWHNEDNYLYSINYHHHGAPKQWYGVPGTQQDADGLEKVFKSYLSMKMRDVPDLLHHITTQFSPRLLQNANVPIYKLLQHEGEFVVTFPRAFHGGFSMGPNIGEAVNFATHDWIAHGSDANERYRSFARPAVFSHDRLTFTMAHHLSELKSYKNCKLLLKEVERVVAEELQLRRKLLLQGVRDVSDIIQLRKNRLDQLDEDSADYDDKRLCHACKHVCFFSAVACECSQSKVSCLRHSHYMCRCTAERRYLMIWSSEEELNNTCRTVREHCENLKPEGYVEDGEVIADGQPLDPLPTVAVGVEQDLELHKDDVIPTDPYIPVPRAVSAPAAEVTTDEDPDVRIIEVIVLDDSDDDEDNDNKQKDKDYQEGNDRI